MEKEKEKKTININKTTSRSDACQGVAAGPQLSHRIAQSGNSLMTYSIETIHVATVGDDAWDRVSGGAPR